MAVSINEMKDRLDSLTRGQNVVNQNTDPRTRADSEDRSVVTDVVLPLTAQS